MTGLTNWVSSMRDNWRFLRPPGLGVTLGALFGPVFQDFTVLRLVMALIAGTYCLIEFNRGR